MYINSLYVSSGIHCIAYNMPLHIHCSHVVFDHHLINEKIIVVQDVKDCCSVSNQMACNLTFCINEYFLKYPQTPMQCGILALDKFLKCFKLKEELTQSINLSLESEEKHIPSMKTSVQVSVKKLSSDSLSLLGTYIVCIIKCSVKLSFTHVNSCTVCIYSCTLHNLLYIVDVYVSCLIFTGFTIFKV